MERLRRLMFTAAALYLAACTPRCSGTAIERYGHSCIGRQRAVADTEKVEKALSKCNDEDRAKIETYFGCAADACREDLGASVDFLSCAENLGKLSAPCQKVLRKQTLGATLAEQLMDLAWEILVDPD